MSFADKIIPYEKLANWRKSLPLKQRPLVVTNGCFDVVHRGHLFLLERAKTRGRSLLVGLTSDKAVTALKGPSRPVLCQDDRISLLAAMEAVTAVCVFPQIDASEFLSISKPDHYVKGGDYTIETLNQGERRILEALGVPIELMPRFETLSSTKILDAFVHKK